MAEESNAERIERLTPSEPNVGDVLFAEQNVVRFRGAALSRDDFPDEKLRGLYGEGFELEGHTMVIDCGFKAFVFESADQMIEERGLLHNAGINAGYAIPNELWDKVASKIEPSRLKDFRQAGDQTDN